MTNTARDQAMHEWPLAVFTALAIPAAGVCAARPIVYSLGVTAPRPVMTAAAGALVAGLAVSLWHLGRPARAPLAVRRAGRNALSSEVFLAAVVLALSALESAAHPAPPVRLALVSATGLAALLLLAVVGLVYFLPARRPWRSALVASPLALGLAAGVVALASAGVRAPLLVDLALALLAADAIVAAFGWTSQPARASGFDPVHPAVFERRRTLIALRFVTVDVVPAVLLLAGHAAAAGIVLGAGVFVDRLTFYGTVCARTTEAEIATIERVIAGSAPR